jgi:hypothetical protein
MHIRTQVREAVADALALACPQFEVFASFKYARNVGDKPMLDVRFLNENIDTEVMGHQRRRTASLYFRLQRPATEEQIDDLLDQDEIDINNVVMASGWWDGLLTEEPEQKQVNWSDTDEGGRIIGTIVLRYDIEYRVTQFDLETSV